MDAVRSMLISANLPKFLWAEAVSNAIYTQNRLISHKTGKVPIELFFNESLKEFNFQLFGGVTYSRIVDEKRKKLDDKAEKLIFVNYDLQTKGFRLYDPSKRRVIVSRNVKFVNDLYYKHREIDENSNEDSIVDDFMIELCDTINQPEPVQEENGNVQQEAVILRRSGRATRQPDRYGHRTECIILYNYTCIMYNVLSGIIDFLLYISINF
jgi:hypothetical protein